MTTAMMMMTSAHSGSPWIMPVTAEMKAATMSMMTIGSAICSKKRFQSGVFSSFSSSLCPYCDRRLDASAAVRPLSSLEESSPRTLSLDSRYSFIQFPSWEFGARQIDARS